MPEDDRTILDNILAHMAKEGGPANTWYAGITSNIEERVYGYHRVPRENHWLICQEAQSVEAARQLEKVLIYLHGCDGGTGGGDETATIVYCYKKTHITNP